MPNVDQLWFFAVPVWLWVVGCGLWVPVHISGYSHNMAVAVAAISLDRFGSNSKLSFYTILEAYILS